MVTGKGANILAEMCVEMCDGSNPIIKVTEAWNNMKEDISKCKFKVGDIVRVKMDAPPIIAPVMLVRRGHPNRFHVIEIGYPHKITYPEGTISLKECCGKEKEESLCSAHPAELFELIDSQWKKQPQKKRR